MTYARCLRCAAPLWLGALLIDRHGINAGRQWHAATAMSLVSLFSPASLRPHGPRPGTRRRWLTGFHGADGGTVCGHGRVAIWVAGWRPAGGAGAVTWCCSMRTCVVLPGGHDGRAMSVFTMALFLGGAEQWDHRRGGIHRQAQGPSPTRR